jgi:acyl-lipid omega-6 desaturase (Delta-12 desaturase)
MEMKVATSSSNDPKAKSSLHKMPPWHSQLVNYRAPNGWTASWQLMNTFLPYCGLWALMILSIHLGYPYAITLLLAVIAALFLVRLFVLFHDCVHGSLFPKKGVNTFFGHALGLLVFTPFDDWRFSHLRHHASYADLDARGFGDIWIMTRAEYNEASSAKRLAYRLYRNPAVLIGLGALFIFVLRFRLPTRTAKRKERMSVIFTNLLIVVVVLLAARILGLRTYLLVQLPVIWLAGTMGVWLFYVQHQFEGVYWARRAEWDALRAAMEGSSFYDLPPILRWFSANIGYHHVHHLHARIPNYRLGDCYESIPALRDKPALTIRKSLSNIHLKLWDEERKELVGFR